MDFLLTRGILFTSSDPFVPLNEVGQTSFAGSEEALPPLNQYSWNLGFRWVVVIVAGGFYRSEVITNLESQLMVYFGVEWPLILGFPERSRTWFLRAPVPGPDSGDQAKGQLIHVP